VVDHRRALGLDERLADPVSSQHHRQRHGEPVDDRGRWGEGQQHRQQGRLVDEQPRLGLQKQDRRVPVAEDRRRITDLCPGRSADPFEELAGPVDDVHGG